MSGGFFRGTSADQDTRFSNKQAKLLKTQKFAAELDHLVDMTKVKMDVMKPWIARRVTELLGFEDEVLINFVYGLLDGKVVDGKQIQIQLTGFMEKNTGKFMRELWGLLLSAQKNASGVPQQFLDEKEEEIRKKKVESDRITQEIQKKKEWEGHEPTKQKRMEGEADISRHVDATSDSDLKHSARKDSSANPEDERELDRRHDSRGTSRQRSFSPHSNEQSPSLQRSAHAKSSSPTSSNSRSYSEDERKSRSISISASPPRLSTSQDRRRRSPPKYSVSPPQLRSPHIPHSSRQKSPYLKRRSSSRTRHRSPSPVHRRSPVLVQHRSPPSPSPLRRRSSSPLRRQSPTPLRRRSPSPPRRRSPPRYRYQSPPRRRRQSPSPSWRRSPLRRRSPIRPRRRSPSPSRRRSPSPRERFQSPVRRISPSLRRRSPRPRSPTRRRRSPLHSPRRHAVGSQSSPRQRNRIQVSQRTRSPSQSHRSSSREHSNHGDGVESGRNRKRSPAHSFRRAENEKSDLGRNRVNSSSEQPLKVRSGTHAEPSQFISHARGPSDRENRVHSPSKSPVKHKSGSKARYDSPGASRGESPDARKGLHQKINSSSKKNLYSPTMAGGRLSKRSDLEESSPEKSAVNESVYVRGNQVDVKLTERHEKRNMEHPESDARQVLHLSEDVEYGPGKADENFLPDGNDNERFSKQHAKGSSSPNGRPRNEKIPLENSYPKEVSRTVDRKSTHLEDNSSYVEKSRKKLDKIYQAGPAETDAEENEIYKSHKTDKRSKKSEHNETATEDEAGYDSAVDHRKEAKRRRKEEKKMRKEGKRRRREERHRKKEERRAQKKAKYMDTVTPPPDYEGNNIAEDSDDDSELRVSKTSDTGEAESEQKKLEIELRNKALESLRAKKAISH